MTWQLKKLKKIQAKNSILVEGLPGMGNVGKIAVDFMIENLNAEKVLEITSHHFPHCVFVNEDNLVELPKIEIYQKNLKDKTLFLLAGDIQPLDEISCYEFCEMLLGFLIEHKGKEIITLGGIGQQKIPDNPKVFCTGNTKSIIKQYAAKELHTNIHGVVGPIIGVTGLLVGLAEQKNIPAIALLAETYSHPAHLGIKEAREILKLLSKKLKLNLDINQLNFEIEEIEKSKKKIDEIKKIGAFGKIKRREPTDYIG